VQGRLPRSAHPALTPCALYQTQDGWIYLMCNKEKFWPALCKAIGHPEWATDPRFVTFKERLENRPLVEEYLDGALTAKTTAEWLEIFAGTVPAAAINDVKQALDNPFVVDKDRLQEIELEGHGTYRYVAPAVRSGGSAAPANPAPKLGADTDELLSDAGFDAEAIAKLKEMKII
jgi:succinate--hydroxymethylglutarate CoA-transferase